MDAEMAELVAKLLEQKMVAIISGGAFEQFERQLPALKCPEDLLKKLFFFPTTGTRFYRYSGRWKQVYADEMMSEEREKIKEAFEKAFRHIHYQHPKILYGEVIEDRGTQVTFSALGQRAPIDLKKQYKGSQQDNRREIIRALEKYLPEFEIMMPGYTSIDITKKGVDKAYGIKQIGNHLGISIGEMIFVGDALYIGGNDYAVKAAGVDCIEVAGPEDTKNLIRQWLTIPSSA